MICWAARNEKLILREGIWFYEEKIVCMDTDQKNLKKNKKIEKTDLFGVTFQVKEILFANSLAKCG